MRARGCAGWSGCGTRRTMWCRRRKMELSSSQPTSLSHQTKPGAAVQRWADYAKPNLGQLSRGEQITPKETLKGKQLFEAEQLILNYLLRTKSESATWRDLAFSKQKEVAVQTWVVVLNQIGAAVKRWAAWIKPKSLFGLMCTAVYS